MELQKLLDGMTLRDKAAQMTQFAAFVLDEEAQVAATGPLGALGITAKDVDQCGSTFNVTRAEDRVKLQEKHLARDPNHIPMVFMQDVIHGFRTIYPIPLAMACSFDPALVKDCAAMAAKEAAVAGVDVVFSPMVDVSRDARWGRCMEGAGEDTYLGCEMAKAQVAGYRTGMDGKAVEACVKHFAAYGAGEAGREYNTVDMSQRRLRERYLPPYKAALDAGAACVMPSFNTLDGVPSVANRALMQDTLRQAWGFDGVTVSDYSAVGELIPHGVAEDEARAAELALNAGCDMEMMTTCYLHSLETLVAQGRVTMAQVDAAVLRILRLKEKLGLFEHPEGQADAAEAERCSLSEKHRAIARAAAEQTAVLLKNDGLLPLDPGVKKLAVIGPFAESGMIMGAWSVNGKAEETVTVAQGIRDFCPGAEVRVCLGCGMDTLETAAEQAEAAALAKWADAVVLCLGEEGEQSGESNCRARLELPEAQRTLLHAVCSANANTAVLLLTGRPLAIPEVDETASAILCMWQPGTEGGTAAARLLFGQASPCGHLAMTFPRMTGQEPISYDLCSTGRPVKDPFHSQGDMYQSRWIDCPVAPLYPFGHGLSYTTFTLSGEKLSAERMTAEQTLTASCMLTNTGARAGTTVVQLYLHDCVGSVARPVRELRGFRKVTLSAGESQQLDFTITEEMLRFETLDKGFASEPGQFEVILALDAQSGKPLAFRLG